MCSCLAKFLTIFCGCDDVQTAQMLVDCFEEINVLNVFFVVNL